MTVIVNSSPFLALERIGCLQLLPDLFQQVVRPQSVWDELTAGSRAYGISEELSKSKWIKTLPDPPTASFRPELGNGETAAIALAIQEKADLILLDDLAARNVAEELGLQISGTLGVLIAGYQKKLITDIEQPIHDLRDCGFHMSDSLVRYVKKQSMENK